MMGYQKLLAVHEAHKPSQQILALNVFWYSPMFYESDFARQSLLEAIPIYIHLETEVLCLRRQLGDQLRSRVAPRLRDPFYKRLAPASRLLVCKRCHPARCTCVS